MSQITRARVPLAFLSPKFNLWVLKLVTWVLPYWLKYHLQISRIDAVDIDRLVEMYKQSQVGRLRLVLAFRHPSSLDPFCLGYLFTKILPAAARKHRIKLTSPVFAHFLYNLELTRWSGDLVGWLLSRLGGIPIQRGRADQLTLTTARDVLVDGLMPLALSPEGGSNGQSEVVEPLEVGAAQLCFWAMEDLMRAGRAEDVFIVAVGIQYFYIGEQWEDLEELIYQLERECGLEVDRHDSLAAIQQSDGRPLRNLLYGRFYRLCQHLVYQVEDFYSQFHHYQIPERLLSARKISRTDVSNRVQQLLEFALRISESHFSIPAKGTHTERCRRLDQVGWDWIYREEMQPPSTFSPVTRALADRIATEADLRIWHLRIVESLVAISSPYIKDKPTFDRFAEITLLFWDLLAYIKGDKSGRRPSLGERRVQIVMCNPIPISDYWDRYQQNRDCARQAVVDLTQELQTAMEGTIDRGRG